MMLSMLVYDNASRMGGPTPARVALARVDCGTEAAVLPLPAFDPTARDLPMYTVSHCNENEG